jgi:hypothetical protein
LAAPSAPTPSRSPAAAQADAARRTSAPAFAKAPLPSVKEKSYYRSALVFGAGVIAVAVILFAVVRDINISRAPAGPSQPQEDDPLFAEMKKHPDFKAWVGKWREVDPYVSVAEFTRMQADAIRTAGPDAAVTPSPGLLAEPLASRFVWSPGKSRFVDYLSRFGEPDSSLEVFSRDGGGKLETIAYCGTPCRFDGAFWLDDDRAVVLGIEEGLKADGTPLCLPPSGAQGAARCYQRLDATVYDFAHDTQTKYRSENHLFAAQPFEKDARDRWAAGLAPEDRAALGLDVGGNVEVVAGTIGEIVADARILTLVGGRIPRIVTVTENAPIKDEAGKLLPFSALVKGFVVEAQTVKRADGSVVAAALRVVQAPNIIVDAPRDGDAVGARFSVTGVARVFEGNVRLRLTDGRTRKVLLDRFTTAAAPDAGLFGPFSFKASLPAGSAKKGDLLTLEVFDVSASDGNEIDKVVVPLRYSP